MKKINKEEVKNVAKKVGNVVLEAGLVIGSVALFAYSEYLTDVERNTMRGKLKEGLDSKYGESRSTNTMCDELSRELAHANTMDEMRSIERRMNNI